MKKTQFNKAPSNVVLPPEPAILNWIYDDDYWTPEVTKCQSAYAPTKPKDKIQYWLRVTGEARAEALKDLAQSYPVNMVRIHSIVAAHLATPGRSLSLILGSALFNFAAKETLELVQAAVLADDELKTNKEILFRFADRLEHFEDLPEIGFEEALTGRHTAADSVPTCLEETDHYWIHASYYWDEDFLEAAKQRVTNPKMQALLDGFVD